MESLRDKTAKGIMWGGLSNGMIQLLGMLFGIILLRLLTPDDYGKIAVLLIFSNIANSLQESGFIAALCNRKNPTDEEYNAVFWFNILVSITLYVMLWFASPFIARFYHEPVLTNLARFLFLGFVISAAGTVQRAYLFGHMLVKQNSIISIIALVISNTIGVIMAWQGFAFWGLATQSVSYIAIVQIGCWSVSSWRPTFHINLRPAFQMFGFTSKLLVTYLFNQLNSQVLSVLLGRFYSPTIVGYYSNARKWDDMATTTINGMLSGVAQPVLAQITNDDSRYRMVFRKMLRFISFISFPCMIGLGLISHEFILIVIGSKWEESSTLLSMLCLYGAFFPISTLYSSMAVSRGKSGINMFCTISLCILVWIGLVIISPLGFYYMLAFFITINILWLLVWQYFAWKLIRLSLIDALKDVIPFFIFSSVVMATTWYLTINITNIYILLISKIIIASILYFGLTWLSGAKIMRESIEYIKRVRS